MNKKKILAVIMVLFIFLCGTSVISIADSGWDFDYDSGDSDWGSDWDSSDWDSDYDYNGSGYVSDGSGDGLGWGAIITTVIIIIVVALINSKNGNSSPTLSNMPNVVGDDEFAKYPGFNKEEFLSKAFEIYKGVQTAWSDFDYDTLRKLTTDEMYNMYKMQLETLSVKNQKNIMKDFNKSFIGITNIGMVNGILTVTVRLNVSQKDYVVNSMTNEVMRGNENAICSVSYDLTFVNNKETGKVLTNCPNCGAPIANSSSQKCEYCNADLVGNATDNWVLAKKQNIRQGR